MCASTRSGRHRSSSVDARIERPEALAARAEWRRRAAEELDVALPSRAPSLELPRGRADECGDGGAAVGRVREDVTRDAKAAEGHGLCLRGHACRKHGRCYPHNAAPPARRPRGRGPVGDVRRAVRGAPSRRVASGPRRRRASSDDVWSPQATRSWRTLTDAWTQRQVRVRRRHLPEQQSRLLEQRSPRAWQVGASKQTPPEQYWSGPQTTGVEPHPVTASQKSTVQALPSSHEMDWFAHSHEEASSTRHASLVQASPSPQEFGVPGEQEPASQDEALSADQIAMEAGLWSEEEHGTGQTVLQLHRERVASSGGPHPLRRAL